MDSVGKIPSRRAWQPTLVFLPGESHRCRCLVSCSPWGPKESDMTEQLTPPPSLMTSLGSRGLLAVLPGPTCAWAAAGVPHSLCDSRAEVPRARPSTGLPRLGP